MCRCCQSCLEDLYWNCFEEKFCYDESIANYNPEEDEEYLASQKNGLVVQIRSTDNNNLVAPIRDQPLRSRNLILSSKIHEEDYVRETQTNVPMLGPEILSVFANSQIFQDHQPTKLNRISTKPHLANLHSSKDLIVPKELDHQKIIKRLEDNLKAVDSSHPAPASFLDPSPDKRITFTLSPDSSPEASRSHSPKIPETVAEEEPYNEFEDVKSYDEVILRPRLIDIHSHLKVENNDHKKPLRSVKSVPYFNARSIVSETDIFSISGSVGQISMTPEVPSISFSNLPKNYEDTPTIEKYKVSQSLYSIQAANEARASQIMDYSMPRYFRRSTALSQPKEIVGASTTSSKEDLVNLGMRKTEKEKSRRLQLLRENLPPLLIHSIRKRDETKQMN